MANESRRTVYGWNRVREMMNQIDQSLYGVSCPGLFNLRNTKSESKGFALPFIFLFPA